jgi:DnaJ-domain-containing protein 1
MAAALDYLLSAGDPFSLFGLERSFDLNVVQLDERYADLTAQARALAGSDAGKSRQLLQKLDDGRAILADPVSRGEHLLRLLGGLADPKTDALPPAFRERVKSGAVSGSSAEAEAERRRLVLSASSLFRQLGSADNGVVQASRRRQIRETLNALREIDRMRAGASE